MKIKELHLRNIASIEEANIDFEHAIVDMVTGTPASIFLIAGDTGAGKSVILDGIAMALYKKTPRIAGVANKTNNEFTDNEGQAISVNSIEQYTRLGISENDKCYSELVFEGNDEQLYRAKLELGLTKGRDKQLKYRTPKWTVKVGEEDWTTVAAKTGQPIQDAVGLTFEQFGRMAMLAQGQFASFLTGDKKERESILEQLTNTERFSKYGEAIKNIFTATKELKNKAEEVRNTEKGHTLEPAVVQEQTDRLAELTSQKKELETQQQQVQGQYDTVKEVLTTLEARAKAAEQMAAIVAQQQSDSYKSKVKMVADWDSTTQERQLLQDKRANELKRKKAEGEMERARIGFVELSADLAYREAQIAHQKEGIARLEEWVAERQALDALYTNAQTTIWQLEQYKAKCDTLTKNKADWATAAGLTDALKQAWEAATKQVEVAKAAVKEKQQLIDAKNNELKELNPDNINSCIKQLSQRRQDLSNLNTQIQQYQKDRTQIEDAGREIEQETKELEQLAQVLKETQAVVDEKKRADDEARALLSTMKMSVAETLTELRKRLEQEHADTCPLCGQPIDMEHLTHDFSGVLTPLQEREKAAHDALVTATTARDEAQKKHDTAKGALESKTMAQAKRMQEFEQEKKQIQAGAKKLNLEVAATLPKQIEELLAGVGTQISALEQQQKTAGALQKTIAQLMDDKKPLDAAQEQALKDQLSAKSAFDQNVTKVNNLTQAVETLGKEIEALVGSLSPMLAHPYPTWDTEADKVKQALKQDSALYCQNKTKLEKEKVSVEKAEEGLASAKKIREGILAKYGAWNQPVTPKQCACGEMNTEWVNLNTNVGLNEKMMKDADGVIAENSAALEAYYQASGNTEATLDALLNAEQTVKEARQSLSETEVGLKAAQESVKNANENIAQLLAKLGVEKLEEVPDKAPLEEQLAALNAAKNKNAQDMGAIATKLSENAANIEKLNAAEQQLAQATARYEKWFRLNSLFGGNNFRTLVQTYILRPLLNNANIYLERITDRYTLTCSEENEQLSILVLDRYNKNQVRSATVLSGGERFMISLALSLALSSLNRQDMNVNILFIDEGFGTLDETNLNSVMSTLEKLQEIAGQTNRRVGIISHREELLERIPVKIQVKKRGEGRSHVEITRE